MTSTRHEMLSANLCASMGCGPTRHAMPYRALGDYAQPPLAPVDAAPAPWQPPWARHLAWLAVTAALAGAGCGKRDRAQNGAAQGSGTPTTVEPAAPALVAPPLGADSVRRFNYLYGDGAAAYDKALAAYKAKPRDWAAARAGAEAALAKDSFHLDAHRLLAAALAQDGDFTGAAGHLALALAGDPLRLGPALGADPDFTSFWSSPVGKQLAELSKSLTAEHLRRAQAGLLLVGRRASFRLPGKTGVVPLTSRGELYAYDRELGRYLRLSQTDHQVVGFVRSPSLRELALVGFDKVELGAGGAGAEASTPPLLARPWAITLDATTFAPLGKRATLSKARRVAVGYGPGEQLLAATAPADGRWGVGAEAWVAIDRTTGKTTRTSATAAEVEISITLEDGEVEGPLGGIVVPDGSSEVATLATPGGTEVRIPESGKASRRSIALSPGGSRLAFATAADPCSPDTAPSLYVADAKTGALHHVLTGKSRFATRWVDELTLAYDDPDGMVRLWDAGAGRELTRLSEKAGLSLAALAMSPAPLCKTAPPKADTAPADSEEPPLPEPGADDGNPVVAPQ